MQIKIKLISWAKNITRFAATRYAATGMALLIIDIATFLLLASLLEVSPALSQLIARACGATFGFFGHKYFSFRNNAPRRSAQLQQTMEYGLVTLISITTSPILLSLILETSNSIFFSKIVTDLTMIILNYVLLGRVFRKSEQKD